MSINELQTFAIEHSEPGMEFTVRRDESYLQLFINARLRHVYSDEDEAMLRRDIELMQDGYLYCSGHVTKNSGR